MVTVGKLVVQSADGRGQHVVVVLRFLGGLLRVVQVENNGGKFVLYAVHQALVVFETIDIVVHLVVLQFRGELAMFHCVFGLLFERSQAVFYFVYKVVATRQIVRGSLQFSDRFGLLRLEFGNACRILENDTPVLRL